MPPMTSAASSRPDIVDAAERSVRADLQKAGVTIVEPEKPEEFQKATAAVYAGFTNWTPGLYDRVQGILQGK